MSDLPEKPEKYEASDNRAVRAHELLKNEHINANNSDSLVKFVIDYTEYKTNLTRKFSTRKPYLPPDPKKINAFIPGTIKKIYVKEKDKVRAGDKLLILEAMKMRNDLITTINGKIKKIYVQTDDRVANKQILVELE